MLLRSCRDLRVLGTNPRIRSLVLWYRMGLYMPSISSHHASVLYAASPSHNGLGLPSDHDMGPLIVSRPYIIQRFTINPSIYLTLNIFTC